MARTGATDDEIEMVGFDWDYVPYVDCGGICGPFGTREIEIIEETDDHVIQRDYLGRTAMLCKGTATLPLPLDFPVKTSEDWERLRSYYEYDDTECDIEHVQRPIELQARGYMVRAEIPGAWDTVRELMGEEEACLAYYTQPELLHDIMDTLRETSVRVLEQVQESLTIDQLFVHEDMAGKSGPLIGPQHVRLLWDPTTERVGRRSRRRNAVVQPRQ